MFKKLLFMLMFIPSMVFSQSLFNSPYYADISDTDSTVEVRYLFNHGDKFSGSMSLYGVAMATVAGDSAITLYMRLIMKTSDPVLNGAVYDSSGWHTIAAQDGDSWDSTPGTSGKSYSFDLAEQDFWKPCAGILVKYDVSTGGTWAYRISAYVNRVNYYK